VILKNRLYANLKNRLYAKVPFENMGEAITGFTNLHGMG